MAENTGHTEPPGKSREQILKDLETAGLLRHIEGPPVAPRENAKRPAGVVIRFKTPAPKPSARKAGRRRLAIAIYILVAGIAAWLYLAH